MSKEEISDQVTLEVLALEKIRIDGDTQPRTAILPQVVDAYRRDMRKGAHFPPVEVVFDGTDYWLFDGFHRFIAARLAHRKVLKAIIHQGTRQDALWRCLGANASHGLRRSNEDKAWAVGRAIRLYPDRSTRFIAMHVGVDHKTVRHIRGQLESTGEIPHLSRLCGRDGRWRQARLPWRARRFDPWTKEEFIPGSVPWNKWHQMFGHEMPSWRHLPDYDAAGHRLTDHKVNHIREVFNCREELLHLTRKAEGLQEDILMSYERRGRVYADFDWKRVDGLMDEVVGSLRVMCPHSICPRCNGGGCDACSKRGWVHKELYEDLEPQPCPLCWHVKEKTA